MSHDDAFRLAIVAWFQQAKILIYLIVIAWGVAAVNFSFMDGQLNRLGLRPRTLSGLIGIWLCPFLHGDWFHLSGNTGGFFALGGLILLQAPENFWVVTLTVLLIGGAICWLIGRNTTYVGASGVIFGYLGFLLAQGYFTRDIPSVLAAILVGFFYSKYLWGLLPMELDVAWEGHLFGFAGGMLTAYHLDQLKGLLQPTGLLSFLGDALLSS